MEVYLAPMQGLTDWIFRESFYEHIGSFDKAFSPFIRVQNGDFYHPSQCNDILPTHNTFQKPIPQFLGNDGASFQRFEELCLKQNYTEVNINLGCPFIKVTSKGMGAGILPHPEKVNGLLEAVFATTKLKVSVKCRLGLEQATEFEQLIPVFNNFPIEEMIIHPRVGKQMYKGEVNMEAFGRYAPMLKHPICYNGDIVTIADLENVQAILPGIDRVMIGRGILQNPFLLAEIKNLQVSTVEKVSMLKAFHLSLIERCKEKYSGDLNILRRLEEMWAYHADGFENGRKVFKQVKKCNTLAKYEVVLFKAIKELI